MVKAVKGVKGAKGVKGVKRVTGVKEVKGVQGWFSVGSGLFAPIGFNPLDVNIDIMLSYQCIIRVG